MAQLKAVGKAKQFRGREEGTVMVPFALMLPVLLAAVLGGLDFAWALKQKTYLQVAADAAAVAGGKELSLSDARRENVEAVVKALVERSVAANTQHPLKKVKAKPTVNANVVQDPLRVEVTVRQATDYLVGDAFGIEFEPIEVTSVAQVVGQPNICVLSLHPTENQAISLEHQARVTGRDCAVYANSKHNLAIAAKNSANLTASFICSRGGRSGGPGNFDPAPMTDCPGFDDPLAGRNEPLVSGCAYTDLVIDGGMQTLKPGTYCGGLTIRGGATVTLDPGVFAIMDGPFRLEGGAAIEGEGVGLYFKGSNARLDFDNNSSVSLTAPVSGDMAGLLMFESRSQPEGNRFDLLSNHAPNLLGTIYISRGELRIDSEATLANESAYTAIVANTMRLYGGPHLILNTNYDKTDVPVPKGIRGAGQPVALVK